MTVMNAQQTLELFIKSVIKGKGKAKKYVQVTQVYTSELVNSNIARIKTDLKESGNIHLSEIESEEQSQIPVKCVSDFKILTEKKGCFKIRLIKEAGIRKPDENGTWGVNVNSFKHISSKN